MATRKKKKQRTMQLMASAALLSTTVAPYVISAEELTNSSVDTATDTLQNSIENSSQTTGDSATVFPTIENTIDNGSEITGSGGNATIDAVGNGTIHSNITTELDTMNNALPVTALATETTELAASNDAINLTHSFTAVEVSPGIYGSTPGSFIESYLKDYFTNAQLVTIDNQKYIELTLSGKAYAVTSFENSTLVSSVGESLEQVRVIRIPAAKESTHKIDAGNYGIYDLTFTFNVTDEQLAETVVTEPEQPVLPAAPKYVEKNVNFQFTTGTDFETGAAADSYLKGFITQTDLVIGEDGKPYADITFGGHSYAGTALKVGSADGPDAEIIAFTGSAEAKNLVRTVRVALDEDYRVDIFFGSARGNYTFKFDLVEEETTFQFTSGTANDTYFSLWVPRADLVETTTGDKYAYVTLAGHSYAVEGITVNSQPAEIISSTGSAETKNLTRVVRVKLDETNKATIVLDGGNKGTYTFTFDFTKHTEPSFTDLLTADYQQVEFDIAAGIPAMFIVPGAIKKVEAKKIDNGISFALQTTKAESTRGSYKTVIVKQNGTAIKEISAENNEQVEFVVPALDGLTIDVVYVTTSTSDTGEVIVTETPYTGTVTSAKLVEKEPEQPTTPDTSAVDPADYTTGSDLDEAIFTEQAKKVKFTFESLVTDIPSAAALAVIVPEATVAKKDDKYEVTLQVNPIRTERLIIAQQGKEIASLDTTDGAQKTLTFTVDNLDHLFFYVDGVSGAATGSIETVIGAEVTGYEVIHTTPTTPVEPETNVTTLPTPDRVVEENSSFTFSTGNETIDSYMKQLINKAQLVEINGQLFADVLLTGNTYGYTHVRLTNYEGEAIAYASNGLTGKELVRTIRIPLDENKQAKVAMFSDIGEDGKRAYDNVFAFNFTPVTKTIITQAADLTATNQAIALDYSATNPATSWHAAAFPSNVKAAAAKAVDGKIQVTLQLATDGLNTFTVAQNGTELAQWANTSSLVTFTVDSLENITFAVNKTATQGTTTMSVNVKEVSLNLAGTLPKETVIVTPKPPVNPEPVQPTKPINVTHGFTAVEVTPGIYGSTPGSFIENYLKDYFTNAQLVTINNKKYIELTLIGKAYGVVSFEGAELVSSTGEKLNQVRVIRIPAAKVSTHRVDAGDYGIYNLTFTFGVTDEQLVVEETPTTPTTPTTPEQPVETPVETVLAPPTKPSNNTNVIIKKPAELKVEKNKAIDIVFNFEIATKPAEQQVLNTLKDMIAKPTIKVTNNNTFEVTIPITPKAGVKKVRVLKDGIELGIWTAPTATARIASLLPFFALNSNEIKFETDSFEGITFEAIDTNDQVVLAKPAVEVNKTIATTETAPSGSGGGSIVASPGVSAAESREAINYKMVGDPNGSMQSFITNYMSPFFSNAELVTVSGKNYIEMTLTGKAYGFQSLRVTGGYTTVSSVGEGLDQVRVIRFPAAKEVTIHADSGELGYGAYDLLFTFDLSEEQLKNAAAAGTGGFTTVQTITPQIVSEGDVKFTIPAEASDIVAYAKKLSAKLVNGKYNVELTLSINADLDTFVVKQGDKVITTWNKKNQGVVGSNVTTEVISFTVDSLENIAFTATTKYRTLTAKVDAKLLKQEDVQQVSKDGRQSMAYTMQADPTGPMADFITGYLAPYFSNAVYVVENDKEFVELTLSGKAYGFATLQYIDAAGQNVDIEVISTTGEGLNQVRVVRLPLVQDKDGVTKIFVDSGDLGYGAYTLLFKFNVPAQSGNNAPVTTTNPFTDIDSIYSKDAILALYAAGITTGTSETTFSPNANMTRAQFAVMVARALGVSSSTASQFKDVQGKWYAAEVQALTEIGIITGVSDTKFKPGDKITRQQAAVIIHRMLQYKGYTNTTTAEALNFKDNAKVADYAKEAFAELQAQGIMTGSDGKVNPKANLTRAQMAKILKNAADLVGLLD